MITSEAYENLLSKCEDLAFLNYYQTHLRETEYRILLILGGHTRHGKQNLSDVRKSLSEYFKQYGNHTHIQNIDYIIQSALRKILSAQIFDMNNVSRETSVNT